MTKKTKIIYLKDYTPPVFKIDEVHLDILLGNTLKEKVTVKSSLQLKKNSEYKEFLPKEIFLNGVDLDLKKISLNGKVISPERYTLNEDGLLIKNPPESFVLETLVEIDIFHNKSLEGMYISGNVVCTQNEAEGFRKITYFLDRSDVMSRFTTTITAPKEKYPILLANGNCIKSHYDPTKKVHSKTFHDPIPKPCYLFALVAGELHELKDSYTTQSNRKINLSIFSEQTKMDKLEFAMQSLKRSMSWDEKVFSLECDLDEYKIVSVDSFNFGAMENKGLNIFNSSLIISDPHSTTDQEQINIEAVIAHEYFHNWSGNRITLRDWFQLSLKEGLTVFRDQEFTADHHSALVKRIEDVSMLREKQFNEDSGPLSHPIQPSSYKEINNFYTATIYEKGAEIVRMYQTLLGKKNFFKALDTYFSRFDGQAITIDDFFNVMQENCKEDITQFKRWYFTHGTPHVRLEEKWENNSNFFEVTLSQKIPNNTTAQPLLIPLNYTIFMPTNKENKTVKTISGMFLLSQQEQKFSVEIPSFLSNNLEKKPLISVNQGFSAPITLEQNLGDKDLYRLLEVENDGFNRWELLQRIYLSCFHHYQRLNQDSSLEKFCVDEKLLKIFKTLLEEEKDCDYLAKCLCLPSTDYFIAQESKIDFREISSFRQKFAQQIESHLKEILIKQYHHLASKEGPGERALKNILLSILYLSNASNTHSLYEEMAYQQFFKSKNMTDNYAALSILCRKKNKKSKEVIDAFYQKWNEDNLVINKWFIAQAKSESENTLEVVKKLSMHKKFNIEEPNKVRSLFAVFAFYNYTNFHDPSGSGYLWIAEKIIELDKINPMMAARLIIAFSYYKKLSPTLMEKAKETLEHIQKNIVSKGAKEIVENIILR